MVLPEPGTPIAQPAIVQVTTPDAPISRVGRGPRGAMEGECVMRLLHEAQVFRAGDRPPARVAAQL
ncbi:MAG: hypothetical protein NVSMB22_26670 [Chloroflexota bacterium]